MRVVKEAEERKNEILDVSQRLFSTKGFDDTSIADILNEIGIAKGTLYYHFKSKEEILDAIIERMIKDQVAKAKKIAEYKSVPAVMRVVNAMMTFSVEGDNEGFVLEQIHKPQNALMHKKIQDRLMEAVVPIIAEIVTDGIKEGVFETDYPKESVELVIMYAIDSFNDDVPLNDPDKMKKISGFVYNTERIFGAKEGSLMKALLPLFK